ncbi:MAG: polysaccharide export protein [Oceanospirillaceae bacterium]|nr:polysaccharide export protein [Oceanospirillaceae bacterium]
MKKLQRQIVKLLSSLILFSVCMNTYAEGFSDYRLGTGDKLSIKVFGEEELSAEVTLSDAGTISYPFLGEIKVLGMTIGSLSKLITTRLADGYLVNPSINVQVIEYREFYINGEVKNPGAYPYQPGLTLQKAAALAGGFTERASGSKMYVMHDGHTTRQKIRSGAKISPGDVITIEESFF